MRLLRAMGFAFGAGATFWILLSLLPHFASSDASFLIGLSSRIGGSDVLMWLAAAGLVLSLGLLPPVDSGERRSAGDKSPETDESGLVQPPDVQEARSDSESGYRELIERFGDVVYRISVPDGRYEYFSPTSEQVFGHSAEEVLANPLLIRDIIDPEFSQCFRENWGEIKRGRISPWFEYRVITPDGQKKWIRQSSRGIFDDKGNIIAIEGICRDITDLKLAEIALQKSEERLVKLSACLLGFGADITENTERLTSLIGEVLGAACALYNQMDNGVLHSVACWGIPRDLTLEVEHEGQICADVIRNANSQAIIVRDLQNSKYAEIDPSIKSSGLQTYIGQAVKCCGNAIGSLCVLFKDDFEPTHADLELLRIVASALEVEEGRRNAEVALRDSESRFRAMFEHMSSGVAIYEAVDDGEDFIFKDFNPAGLRMEKVEKEDIIGKRVTECFPGVRDIGLLESFRRVWKTGKPERHPISLYRDDSHVGWRENYVYLLSSGEVVAIYDDVTDRKQAEEALGQSEAKYRSLTDDVLESSGVGIFILNAEFEVVWVNDALLRFFGLRKEELIGKDKRQLVHDRIKHIFSDGEETANRVLATYDDNTYTEIFECKILPGEGRDERWLEHWSQPIRTGLYAGGRIEHYYDITARKRAEEALRESEERYRLFADNVSDVIWVRELENMEVTYESPSVTDLTGFSLEEAVSLSLAEALAPESLALAERVLKEELELEMSGKADFHRSRTLELEMLCKGGGTVWTESKMTFLRDSDDRPIAVLGVTRNIADRKRAEERLLQAQKMEGIGRLAGGIAHDFNNLLTAIIGNLDLLKMSLPPDGRPPDEIEEISQAALRASELTQQLLAFSRKQIIAPKLMDLNRVINGMSNMLRRLIREDIEISIALGHNLPSIRVDPTQVQQVIMNLALNARDAMPFGGELKLETDSILMDEEYQRDHPDVTRGPYVCLMVRDTGQGMDAETLSHVFEPFFTTKKMGRGTGLGLSTVYGIVKQSGGSIAVQSEKGSGTCFKAYFPAFGERAGEVIKKDRQSRTTSGQGETVLVVEDDLAIRVLIERVLSVANYDVRVASNSEQALALAQELGEDLALLLTDVIMPGMQGKDLAEVIRRICPSFGTIFMSGYTEDVIAHAGVLDEGVDFMSKPFSPQALLLKVREVLDGAKQNG
ncbi:MAG: PAS domain S-box protein [Candidatus Coatesbacteria bacterium]|nr:PAS domain S-box protein [Candidatus Coatesbacteria bacterium]